MPASQQRLLSTCLPSAFPRVSYKAEFWFRSYVFVHMLVTAHLCVLWGNSCISAWQVTTKHWDHTFLSANKAWDCLFLGLEGEILGSTVTAFFSLYRDLKAEFINVVNRKLTVTKCHQLSMLIYVNISVEQVCKKKKGKSPTHLYSWFCLNNL